MESTRQVELCTLKVFSLSSVKFIYNIIKLIVVVIVLVSALILVNIALLLNSLNLLFSPHLFNRLALRPPQLWCCFCMFCFKKLLKFNFTFKAPDLSKLERAVVIANHQSMFDVPVIYSFATSFGKKQHPRWLGKKSFRHAPLLGWGARLSRTIMFLHRDWARDRERLNTNFQELTNSPQPFWLCFFPEGTRITPDKIEASQRYAREKNYPLLHQVLLPRPKGFTAAVHGLRAHVDAVLDISIYYSQRPPFVSAVVLGKPIEVVVLGKLIKPDTLPRDDAGLKQSLLDIYSDKDAQLIALARKT